MKAISASQCSFMYRPCVRMTHATPVAKVECSPLSTKVHKLKPDNSVPSLAHGTVGDTLIN